MSSVSILLRRREGGIMENDSGDSEWVRKSWNWTFFSSLNRQYFKSGVCLAKLHFLVSHRCKRCGISSINSAFTFKFSLHPSAHSCPSHPRSLGSPEVFFPLHRPAGWGVSMCRLPIGPAGSKQHFTCCGSVSLSHRASIECHSLAPPPPAPPCTAVIRRCV